MLWGQPGHLLELVRSGRARTRRELLDLTGLARSTVAARIDLLLDAGYLRESGAQLASRGRPSTVLAFDEDAAVVLAAELGASHAVVAVCDLAGRPLVHTTHDRSVAEGPETALGWVEQRWRELLARADLPTTRVAGFGLCLPGPVDVATGRTVHETPVLPGWFRFPVRERLEDAFGVPGIVDNDANAMAFGEYHAAWPSSPSLVFVKASTGIGSGMVVGGRLLRGADSGEGDIGHVKVGDLDTGPLCACGAHGCLAACAGGRAVARRLREEGFDAPTSRAAVRLAVAGEARAIALVREAGLVVGDVLATVVSLLNPHALVIGGELVRGQHHFLGAVRERLYQRTQPIAAQDLQVAASSLDDRAGVVGAARLLIEQVYAPDAVDRALVVRAAAVPGDGAPRTAAAGLTR